MGSLLPSLSFPYPNKKMIDYQRVLPRDLFNESKLLEQIGRVCLAIHANGLTRLSFDHDGSFFNIQLSDDGSLYISNLEFLDAEGLSISFTTNYNSRIKNPLLAHDLETEEAYFVFDDQGNFTNQFLQKFA